jgi:hypothetical protein
MQPGPTAQSAFLSTEELEIINFGVTHPMNRLFPMSSTICPPVVKKSRYIHHWGITIQKSSRWTLLMDTEKK